MKIVDLLNPEFWSQSTSGPLYIRLKNQIEHGILQGYLKPGNALPSEREIVSITGFSRVTVRKALGELVSQGSVVQKQGSGSFIAMKSPPVEQSLSYLTSFTDDMRSRSLEARSEILSSGVFLSNPEEVVALAISPHDRVSRISRLRIANGKPLAIENASLPIDILPNPKMVKQSLYEVLAKSGNRPVRALQKLRAVNIGPQDAKLLGINTNDAGLKTERISYLPGGRPVEFTQSLYRGDAYDFVAELKSSAT